MLRVIDALEEHDDVQNVYANFDIPDDVLQAVVRLMDLDDALASSSASTTTRSCSPTGATGRRRCRRSRAASTPTGTSWSAPARPR